VKNSVDCYVLRGDSEEFAPALANILKSLRSIRYLIENGEDAHRHITIEKSPRGRATPWKDTL